MGGLFEWLSGLMGSGFLIVLAGSFLWGVFSILLSPCHLASIPLVVGYITDQKTRCMKRDFYISAAFSAGILITITAIGIITSGMGRMMGDIGKWGNYIVAFIFFIAGLYLLNVIRVDIPGLRSDKFRGRGPAGALLLGLIFGVALGPCTFAFMAPVLAITLFSATSGFFRSFLILSFYGMGHCLVIIGAGTFTSIIQRYLKWSSSSPGTLILKKVCGVLVIIGGIFIVTA